jgi:hypothetical protein
MSYTEEDARWDEIWDQMSKELYPEHKEQAIDEFIKERLQSFYLKNPNILSPGIRMYQQARELESNHPSASFVFATSAIELFLKAALLKPVVYGLVHNEPLAEIIVETALSQTGFERYKELLSRLFRELVRINVETLKSFESNDYLLKEASDVQKTRNKIIHQGILVSDNDAKFAINVAYGVLHHIVNPMLLAIGLWMDKKGTVLEREEGKKI